MPERRDGRGGGGARRFRARRCAGRRHRRRARRARPLQPCPGEPLARPPGHRRRALRDGRRGVGRAGRTSAACPASTGSTTVPWRDPSRDRERRAGDRRDGARAGRVRARARRSATSRRISSWPRSSARCLRCSGTSATVDGEPAGCALWFLNFSTWRGVHGIYLEDLFVRPALPRARPRPRAARAAGGGMRRAGYWAAGVVGAGLERARPSASTARSAPSAMDEWTTFRLDGAALTALGSTAPPPTPGTAR